MSETCSLPDWAEGYVAVKQLPSGEYAALAILTFDRRRIVRCDQWSVFEGW